MLKADFHIHSVHSGHGYGTIYDILKNAASKRMRLIAITDHGPLMEGSAPEVHFKMGIRAPKEYRGVKLLWGCEANIIDKNGTIDLSEKTIEKLDILLVGLHMGTPYKDLGKMGNTEALIRCFNRYPVHIFSHPGTIYFDYDLERVFQEACNKDILLEINLSSLVRLSQGHQRESLGLYQKMVEIARKNKKKIIVNSDAHFLDEIGNDTILKDYMGKLKLDKSCIINNYPEELIRFVKNKRWKKSKK